MKKVQDLKYGEVIHCSTEEQAIAICKLMNEAGLEWSNGYSYLESNKFQDYKENTCYHPYSGTFADLEHSEEEGYTIYNASDFLEERKVIAYKLKDNKYLKAVEEIARLYTLDYSNEMTVRTEHHPNGHTTSYERLKEAGVLDLWFEPVYEKEEFKVGDIVVVEKERAEGRLHGNNGNFKKGHIGKITGFQDSRSHECKWLNLDNEQAIIEKLVRKATPEEVKKYNTKLPTINGYEGKDNGSVLSWGCFEILREDVYDLIRLNILTFKIKASGEVARVTEEQFNKIKEYLNKVQ